MACNPFIDDSIKSLEWQGKKNSGYLSLSVPSFDYDDGEKKERFDRDLKQLLTCFSKNLVQTLLEALMWSRVKQKLIEFSLRLNQ